MMRFIVIVVSSFSTINEINSLLLGCATNDNGAAFEKDRGIFAVQLRLLRMSDLHFLQDVGAMVRIAGYEQDNTSNSRESRP